MIEYLYQEGVRPCEKEPLKVRIEGRVVGEIRKVKYGYRYFPNGQSQGGEVFPTVSDVQHLLGGKKAIKSPSLDSEGEKGSTVYPAPEKLTGEAGMSGNGAL